MNNAKEFNSDKLLNLDKFNLTDSERKYCLSIANHINVDRAIEQAIVYDRRKKIKDDIAKYF